MVKKNSDDYRTNNHDESDGYNYIDDDHNGNGYTSDRDNERFGWDQEPKSNKRNISQDDHRNQTDVTDDTTYSRTSRIKKGSWKKGIVVLIIAGLLITLSFTPLFSEIQDAWGGPVYPEKARFSIQRTFDISTNRDIDYNMKLVVPEDIPEDDIQYIRDIEWYGDPSTVEKDGRDWNYWSESLSSGESKSIEIVYEAETRTIDWGYNSDSIGSMGDIPDDLKDNYTGNQWQLDEDRDNDGENDWMIQPKHPDIEHLAENIVEDEDNLYDKSRAIYDWINRNIDYEIGGSNQLPKHSAWVWDSGTGDCDEQSFLYISLSRAVDLPSWLELGVLYDRIRDQWGGHGWVRQIAVDDKGTVGWINIDTVNDQFFARGANRVTFWVDNGTEGNLDNYYHFFNYTSGARVSISEDFKNTDMETEGQVVLGDGELIPGFTWIMVIPAVFISISIYKIRKDLKFS
ncbi:MAG: transglutaminase-like domain-containing protein [Candidatus Saliniplasma sp.]